MRERDVMQLVTSWDAAVGAFLHEKTPGWETARADLRAAVSKARDVGDVAGACVPASFWRLTVAGVISWLDAVSPAEREALTGPIDGLVRTLARYAAGTLFGATDARDAKVASSLAQGGR